MKGFPSDHGRVTPQTLYRNPELISGNESLARAGNVPGYMVTYPASQTQAGGDAGHPRHQDAGQ